MTLSLADRIQLEKAAIDAGFDIPSLIDSDWLVCSSSQVSLRIWLRVGGSGIIVALSRRDVLASLAETGDAVDDPSLPVGSRGARRLPAIDEARAFLRRSYQLAHSLPTAPLENFQKNIVGRSRETEAERLVVQRIGQDIYRNALLEFWRGQCAITGLAVPDLLRASHAKPWSDCDDDADRLNVFNGLLLAAHLDAAFDSGLISIAPDGMVMASSRLPNGALAVLGLDRLRRVDGLQLEHTPFLDWHRSRLFRP